MKSQQPKKSRARGARGDTSAKENGRDAQLFKRLNSQDVIVQRRMAANIATLSTNAAGVIVLTTLASSISVSTLPDFTSAASMWSAYRCKAIKVQVLPFYPNVTTATTVPAAIAVGPYENGVNSTTFVGYMDGPRVKLCSGYKGYEFYADYRKNKDAQLWTPVSSAIAGAEAFGISCIGFSTASTVSTTVWAVQAWYDVELRMPS